MSDAVRQDAHLNRYETITRCGVRQILHGVPEQIPPIFLTAAIQEQEKAIEALKAANDNQARRLDSLEAEFKAYKAAHP